MRSLAIAIPLTLAALTGACGNSSSPSAGDQPSQAQAQAQAQAMFEKKCATCHGIDGKGNGPSADAFDPRPHNYTDPAWQASITDEQIKDIILKGGVNLGKSPAMPSSLALRDRPEVLDGLVKIIRGFGKRP